MTEYRRATESERRRYGVEWRCLNSAWRKQRLASSYTYESQWGCTPVAKAQQLNTNLMVGDNETVRRTLAYSGPAWRNLTLLDKRLAVQAARYDQWLAERDALAAAA